MTPDEAALVARTLRSLAVRDAARYVPDQDAEDVAQTALALLLQRAATIDCEAAVTWLRTTVWKVASSHRRARREVLLAEPPETVGEGDPEATLRSAEICTAVREALSRVPSSRRDVLVAVHGEGLSLAEFAAQHAIPESTARTRILAGAEDLRGEMHRQRVAEKRRSGGFTSWLLMLGLGDARAWSRRGLAGVGAIAAGGALLASLGGEQLGPTPVEAPTRAAVVEPLVQPMSARAELGVEAPATSTGMGARARHDVAARMLRERLDHTR